MSGDRPFQFRLERVALPGFQRSDGIDDTLDDLLELDVRLAALPGLD